MTARLKPCPDTKCLSSFSWILVDASVHSQPANGSRAIPHTYSAQRIRYTASNVPPQSRQEEEEQDNANFLRSLLHICSHDDADGGDAGVVGRTSQRGHCGWV